ncbi:MAG TPA: efflux transporter outer membrane subunit [Luteimonas sp.]|nr:efflux transporter outer membrane subunit [Luteimonas sp.]
MPRSRASFAPIAALSLALALGGCASTHGLAPTDHPMDPDQLTAGRSLGAFSKADFPKLDWWSSFGDPQLGALIDEALAGSPSLAAADARVREAIAQAGLAEAATQPSLGAGAQYSGIRIPSSVAPAPLGGTYKGVILLTLNLKYDPDFWGGKRARWEAALGQARAAEVDAQAARLLLAGNIASAYIGLAQATAAHDVALAEKSRAAHLLALSQQRAKAGIDSQLPLRQAETSVASAQQQADAAQQHIDAARTALAALLGKGPDRGLAITKPVLLQAPAPGVPTVLPSELLGHRPDVVAARWRVESARQGVRASKAAFYPTINLAAMVGLASGGLSNLFNTDSAFVQGGPAISLPIFDGGGLRSQLARSDAEYDLAVAAYNQSLVGALREVTDALQNARALDAQLASAQTAVTAARAAWQLAQARYHAGLGTQLDVLAAQQPLLQLEQQIAALHAQRLDAAVDLDRALGGGLAPDAPTTSDPAIAKAPTP